MFLKIVAFLVSYSEEPALMQKPILEALLKSNRANQVKEWKSAKNFWSRKASTLAVEQREELADWEFVLSAICRRWSLWLFCPGSRDVSIGWIRFY